MMLIGEVVIKSQIIMATSPINIDASCEGTFIIDTEGIRSTEPVELKKFYWDGNTLHLEGESNNNVYNNVVVSGGTFSSISFGGSSSITIGGSSNRGSGGNDYVIIDGVRYKRDNGSACSNSSNKIFDEPWIKTRRGNAVLEGIFMSGKSNFEIRIPLEETCDIDGSGATGVDIYGDNPNSSLNISLSGAGCVRGNGTVKKLLVSLSGAGNASGLTASKQLRAKASGAAKINLNYLRGCVVNKHQSGVAQINLHEV